MVDISTMERYEVGNIFIFRCHTVIIIDFFENSNVSIADL